MSELLGLRWPGSESLVERLGWVLVHTLWQFLLIAVVAAVIARILHRGSAAIRYGVLTGALMLAVSCPVMTWSLQNVDGSSRNFASAAMKSSTLPHLPDLSHERETSATAGPAGEHLDDRLRRTGDSNLDSLPAPRVTPAPQLLTDSRGKIAATFTGWGMSLREAVEPWLTSMVGLWSFGVLCCSLRPILGYVTLRRLRKDGVSRLPDEIVSMLHRIAEQLGIRRSVRVFQSSLSQVPVVVGYLRPVILLPISLLTEISPAQLETILAHELAHVRRHDFLVNLVQTLVETLFFYHPAIWWLSHQIRMEREHCCDDLVVAALGNRLEYGRALLAIAELHGRATLLAPGAADGSLITRIRRIALSPGKDSRRITWTGCLLSTLLFVAAGYGATISLYQQPEQAARAFRVTLSDGSAVELLGVSSDPTAAANWWLPDGKKLAANPLPSVTLTTQSNPGPSHYFAVHSTGFKRLGWFFPGDGQYRSAATGSDSPLVRDELVWPLSLPEAGAVTFHCAAGEGDFGPWVTLNRDGQASSLPLLPPLLAPHYLTLSQVRVESVAGQTQLVLPAYQMDRDRMVLDREWMAIRKSGERVAPSRSDYSQQPPRISFDLSTSDIDHFEFRLRTYLHWVTFSDVSLRPGETSNFKVSSISMAAMPKPLVAQLPTGIRVELRGLAEMTPAPSVWWHADGSPVVVGPPVHSTVLKPTSPRERRGVVRVAGIADATDVIANYHGVRMDFARTLSKDGVDVDVRAFPFNGRQTGRVELGIATQPRSPWRMLDPSGDRISQSGASDDPILDDIEVEIVVGMESSNPRTADDARQRTAITFFTPVSGERQIDLEFRVVDRDGQTHTQEYITSNGPQAKRQQLTYVFDVKPERVQRFEYRMRLYQHWVTFDNLALAAGEQTEPKVVTEQSATPVSSVTVQQFTKERRITLDPEPKKGLQLFFVDLDRASTVTPDFSVELDEQRLPYFVLRPSESELNKWLVQNGIDLILSLNPQDVTAGSGQIKHLLQMRSVRTNLQSLPNGLQPLPGGSWSWKSQPADVVAPFARKDDALHVSSFVPNSSGGEIRSDSPELYAFRTSDNVLGLFLLEQPRARLSDLALRIAYVTGVTTPLADVRFQEGETVSGKLGAVDPPAERRPIRVSLPGARSIELVGFTKNTAAAKSGWRPDGRPLGNIGDWRSTIVLHDGNTSSAYTHGGPHPEPDANAIDLLLRIGGLKGQPSLAFEFPTQGSSYHNEPVKDPYELRIAMRRRGEPGPGARWSTPDGEWRIGLTDEAWGRFVQIDPNGKVLNPIRPDESYAETYALIQVQGSAPHSQISTKTGIALRSPVGQTDPDNPLHRYAFEFRAIDTDGKEHWALNWQGRGIQGTQLEESIWGLAQPLPEGKSLAHYEFRVRPYRYWATFKGVSLEAGEVSDVSVSVQAFAGSPYRDSEAPPEADKGKQKSSSLNRPSMKEWKAKVVDGTTGKPLPGLTVLARPLAADRDRAEVIEATSDVEGHIAINLVEGTDATLVIKNPGWWTTGLTVIGDPSPKDGNKDFKEIARTSAVPAPRLIQVWRGTQVTGTLLLPGGTPAAHVNLSAGVYIDSDPWKERLGMDRTLYSWDHGEWPNWSNRVTTDEAGHFLTTVPPPDARGWVRINTVESNPSAELQPKSDLLNSDSSPTLFAPYERQIGDREAAPAPDDQAVLDFGTLRLDAGRRVRGRVLDAADRPVKGVHLMTSDKHGPYAGRRCVSGEDGRFEFLPLNLGLCTLTMDARLRNAQGEVESRDVQAVYLAQDVDIIASDEPLEITVRAVPHVILEFDWIDRRQVKGPAGIYDEFSVMGQVPREGLPPAQWHGDTEKVMRQGREYMMVKVPLRLINAKLNLPADSVVAASYEDGQTKSGPGQVALGDISAERHRIIYGDEPLPRKSP